MRTQLVEVFLGDEIDDVHERRFLNRLRTDLEQRAVRAHIYANFVAGRDQRQVDFLIRTAHRLVHAELKTVEQSVPLVAEVNGPWHQELPGQELRSLGRSYHRQAHQTTYAISDDMHELAIQGEVPAAKGKYYSHIDTVVCLVPDVPPHSRLTRYKHVDVVGYQALLDRLQTPGRPPEWTDQHWDAFQRKLGLYKPPTDSPGEADRRLSLEVLADYRRRFSDSHRAGLHHIVPIRARVEGEGDSGVGLDEADPAVILAEAVAAQRVAVFTGPSGGGKSHLSHHVALATAGRGGLPVWVRCAEYQPGKFSVALARAVAPFTAEEPLTLLQRAAATGSPAVVILDGLNECPPQARVELLEQLNALRLRIPAAAIITSTESVILADAGGVVRLTAQLPQAEERSALLASYGAVDLPGAEAFRTPLELSLAALCAEDLPSDADRGDVFDAYIQRRCPSETTRAALRHLASEMDDQLRRSLTVAEARGVLQRSDRFSPDTVDDVLRSALLARSYGRVTFVHELFGRFLAAEQLVLESADNDALALALRDPRRGDLMEFVLGVEHDLDRRHGLLLSLADARLLRAAVMGQFGGITTDRVRADVAAALAEAQLDTANAVMTPELAHPESDLGDAYPVAWRVRRPRTPTQQALLHTAGACLADGLFIPETAALLRATDEKCAEAMRQLREKGHRAAITATVQAAYAALTYGPDREATRLPASVILTTCHHERINRYSRPSSRATAVSMQAATGSTPRWGGLYATLLLVNPDSPADLALLPELLRTAWSAGGYHLRLEALTKVHDFARVVDDTTRSQLRDVLDGCDTGGDIMLNSALIEALAAYDLIEPINTADDIRRQITAVLREPENPVAWDTAQGIVGRLFEDESVVGPYSEVIQELDDACALQLYVMAARSEQASFSHDWTMREIAERVDSSDRQALEVLRRAASTLNWEHFMAQEAVSVHLEGLRGLARCGDELPPPTATGGDLAHRTWRVVDELIFPLLRDEAPDPEQSSRHWGELLDLCAPAAVDVLVHLRQHQTYEFGSAPTIYSRLVDTYRDEVRQLFEWGLVNRERLVTTLRAGSRDGLAAHVVAELGALGNANTAALLRDYVPDPVLGRLAVEAIGAIEDVGR